ncbi:uncharacterized protein TNCV_4269161 [Trichonephila clavipes]|nr:uncharacterized protein TNCV_4269161 [Trichonephila clavipes]
MNAIKCIVSSWHGGTLNDRRDVSSVLRLLEKEKRWEAPNHPQGVLSQNWSGIKKNRFITCMVLKAKANERHKNMALCRDEFRGP